MDSEQTKIEPTLKKEKEAENEEQETQSLTKPLPNFIGKAGVHNSDTETLLKNSHLKENISQITKFNNERIYWLDVLGEGSFGMVKKAYDVKVNGFIAVKFQDTRKNPEESFEQIILEDHLLQTVEEIRKKDVQAKEYLLKYDGIFSDSDAPETLIMQMESGCATVYDLLLAGKKYTCEEMMYLVPKITQGFLKLEENGIANRDVKPQNIILVEDNENKDNPGYFYKIADFGIGCHIKKAESEENKAQDEKFIGFNTCSAFTEAFAAPELDKLDEEDIYNPFLADVYSLGITFLKMIDIRWTKSLVLEGEFDSSNELKENYKSLIEVLKGMLQVNPEDRWSFEKVLDYFKKNENIEGQTKAKRPTDEFDFYQKWRVNIKESKLENKEGGIAKLFQDHHHLYDAYRTNIVRVQEILFHVERLWQLIEKFKSTQELNEASKKKLVIMEFMAYDANGVIYQDVKGDLPKAEECFLKALKLKEECFGEQTIEVAVSCNNLGFIYQDLGDFAKAEDFYQKSLKIRMELFGDKDPQIAGLYNNLGNLSLILSEFSKAEENYMKALEIWRSTSGENTNGFAETLNNLGVVNESMGNLPKAEEIYFQALKIRQNLFGDNHPDVAMTIHNLGIIYYRQNNRPKAEEFLIRSLEVFKQIYGETHNAVAQCFNTLGAIFSDFGNLEKAKEFYLDCLKIRQNINGEEHIEMGKLLCNLGILYSDIGDLSKAQEMLLRSLKIMENKFGENHPNVNQVRDNLSRVEKDLEDSNEKKS